MIRTIWAAGALSLAMLSNAAHAQKLEYDCDTQAEHLSELKAIQDGPSYSASATISLRAMFPIKRFATLAGFAFKSTDDSWSAQLRLVATMVDSKPVLIGTLDITRGGKREPQQMIGGLLDYEPAKPYPIKLTLGPDGGSATLGTTTVPVNLKASGKVNVSVICSGGEFLFTDLDLSGR